MYSARHWSSIEPAPDLVVFKSNPLPGLRFFTLAGTRDLYDLHVYLPSCTRTLACVLLFLREVLSPHLTKSHPRHLHMGTTLHLLKRTLCQSLPLHIVFMR